MEGVYTPDTGVPVYTITHEERLARFPWLALLLLAGFVYLASKRKR